MICCAFSQKYQSTLAARDSNLYIQPSVKVYEKTEINQHHVEPMACVHDRACGEFTVLYSHTSKANFFTFNFKFIKKCID